MGFKYLYVTQGKERVVIGRRHQPSFCRGAGQTAERRYKKTQNFAVARSQASGKTAILPFEEKKTVKGTSFLVSDSDIWLIALVW